MQKYRTFLTKKGREKIVAAEAAGTHLALRHVAVGDALDPPTEDLTKLRNEVWRGEVNRIQVDAKDAHVLNVEAVIPAQDGGFMVRELGLFDTEGDLIAVGRAPDSYKPLVEDGAAKSLLIVFKIIIDNTAVVALSVDDSVVLVTREYLAQQLSLHTTNKDNPHGVTKSQVGLGSVSNYAVATEAEAKEGTSNTKYMTPLRTNQLVGQIAGETAGGVQTNLNEHIANDRNPHNVTKAQVGLSNVDNVKQASKEEHDRLAQSVATHLADDASLTKKGHVQLSDSVTSESSTLAATPKAVKTANDRANTAYDRAEAAFTSASNGKSIIGTAITGLDESLVVPADATFQQIADLISIIPTGKRIAVGNVPRTYDLTLPITGLDFTPSAVALSGSVSGIISSGYNTPNRLRPESGIESLGTISSVGHGYITITSQALSGANTIHWIAIE